MRVASLALSVRRVWLVAAGALFATGCATGSTDFGIGGFGGAGGAAQTTSSHAASSSSKSSTSTTGSNTTTSTATGPATTSSTGGVGCGDGVCSNGETCSTCPSDCMCNAVCGNGTCETGETCQSCPSDCTSGCCNNDGICETGETMANCPNDCSTGVSTGSGTMGCHDICTPGGPEDPNACAAQDPFLAACVSDVCSTDDVCCSSGWDDICVSEVDGSFVCIVYGYSC